MLPPYFFLASDVAIHYIKLLTFRGGGQDHGGKSGTWGARDTQAEAEKGHRPGKSYPRGNRSAKIVSVCTQKGGVGKTTTAVSLAAALARFHGRKTLLMDMDAQGHVGSSLLGEVRPGGGHLSELLLDGEKEVMEIVAPTKAENLFVTPSDKHLKETENLLGSKIGKEFILKGALSATRTHYDFIIIDCPPNQGNLTLNALVASRWVVIPTDMSILSFEGVNDLWTTIETVNGRLNPDLDVLGVLLTRVDRRNTRTNEIIMHDLGEAFGEKLFKTQIATNTALSKAQMAGRTIFEYEKSSSGSVNYRLFAEEFIERAGRAR